MTLSRTHNYELWESHVSLLARILARDIITDEALLVAALGDYWNDPFELVDAAKQKSGYYREPRQIPLMSRGG